MKYLFATAGIALFFIAFTLEPQLRKPNYKTIAAQFESTLNSKEKKILGFLSELENSPDSQNYNKLLAENSKWLLPLYANYGFSILIFDNDTLKFWSDNLVPIDLSFSNSLIKDGLIKLDNGWYESIIHKREKQVFVGLILIKHEYPFENRLLKNEFHKDFQIPSNGLISKVNVKNGHPVKTISGNHLFYLRFDHNFSSKYSNVGWLWMMTFLLYIGAMLCLLAFINTECKELAKNIGKVSSTLLFAGTLIVLRFLMLLNSFPQLLYDLPVFGPSYYATSFLFPSLGDFFINAMLVFYLALYMRPVETRPASPLHTQNQKMNVWNWFFGLTGILIVFSASIPLNYLFEGLVKNSNISFNINNLFELNYMSFIGFFSIGLFLFSYYFLIELATESSWFDKPVQTGVILGIGALLFISGASVFFSSDPWLLACSPAIFGCVLFKKFWGKSGPRKVKPDKSRVYPAIILIIVFAAFTSHIISHSYHEKEGIHRKVLVEKLAAETDPIAEYLYSDFEKTILKDTNITELLQTLPGSQEKIKSYIKDQHLRGFWEKYDAQITLCRTEDLLIIKPDNVVRNCSQFFNELIRLQGKPTLSDNFYYLDNNNGRISYLAVITKGALSIYIEFDSKIIPEELGFPELLLNLDMSEHLREALKTYSYAKYKDGQLVNQSGDFPYTTKLFNKAAVAEFSSINFDGYNHLSYQIDQNSSIVLSKKEESAIDPIIRFSYLFVFFCLFVLVYYLLIQLRKRGSDISLNFRKRIELSMIFILLIALIPTVIGTKYYIEKQYNTRNYENIKEKIQSVLIELEQKLSEKNTLSDESYEYISQLLTKFSFVFLTDINLYGLNGDLIASSRPQVFDKGLAGKKMNAGAYLQLAVNIKTEFIHEEQIGNLHFLSAYIPFRNKNNQVLAYLNLPYFAKEDEAQKEISTFFVALINIYVVLVLISIIIALFLSNRITKPLRIMQEKLAQVKIGTSNEPIIWQSKDEIGNLVDEYNRMLKELEKSAELLARSERESAWREMAKQVAHEINNPLTPMKLSVQHLERAWKDKNPEWDEKLKQFTKTMIQQIDALASIAGEFSNFAKIPKTKREIVDLYSVIRNTIELFIDTGNTEITFEKNVVSNIDEFWVLADKKQLLQVLNNLIKNALQSIPEGRKGKIEVRLMADEVNYTVRITDNGSGISEGEQGKIFSPDFTTKTGGMGLGLALVKNMIENSGGHVWFESIHDKGSSFYFSLPKYHWGEQTGSDLLT